MAGSGGLTKKSFLFTPAYPVGNLFLATEDGDRNLDDVLLVESLSIRAFFLAIIAAEGGK